MLVGSRSLKITSRSSHFRGRVKTKVQPLVKTMYGFAGNSKSTSIDYNIKLARELKNAFGFVYAVRLSSLFTYIYLQVDARNVGRMETEASINTQLSSNLSTPYGLTIRRRTVRDYLMSTNHFRKLHWPLFSPR